MVHSRIYSGQPFLYARQLDLLGCQLYSHISHVYLAFPNRKTMPTLAYKKWGLLEKTKRSDKWGKKSHRTNGREELDLFLWNSTDGWTVVQESSKTLQRVLIRIQTQPCGSHEIDECIWDNMLEGPQFPPPPASTPSQRANFWKVAWPMNDLEVQYKS